MSLFRQNGVYSIEVPLKMTLLLFLLSIAVSFTFATESTSLDESQVFEWWDDGIIDSDEAREILDLLEEGNNQEACILAEVYALESCASEEIAPPKSTDSPKLPKAKKRKNAKKTDKQQERPSLVPHGYLEWRGRTDSLGHLESQRTEIRIDFYRYSLRLGTQSLLTYRNAGSEAYFGQVSTKELHSTIPTDTLWGTALLYPVGIFQAEALLDTAMTTRLNMGIAASPDFKLELAYWHHQHPADSIEKFSLSTQAKGNWGSFAAWWAPENKKDLPLMKLQLQYREKMEYATLGWKTEAYAHGDSLPQEAHLSSTIVKSRFWGSQNIGITFHDPWKSRLSLNARTMIPLEGDTSKTRFKASTESGPDALRGTVSATCISAEDRCRQNDFALKIRSTWNFHNKDSAQEHFVVSGKIRARLTRGEGFEQPLYEAGAMYAEDASNSAGIAVTVPKGTPSREIRLRSNAEVGNDFLRLSLAVTFRRTAEEALHPLHAAMKAKIIF